ncbi:uncharacterized protein LOC135225033 [Macrobrachium nipponense]|uniref:uncharacterized protein LOC135225033 n=1 Tax=Macrobrachium nipponense TaxID=159736 RepID=UPI0030C8502A
MISKQPLKRRDKIHESKTKDFIHSLQEKCIERSDKWGNEVHVRIQNIGDTVAADVKYHHDCQVSFHKGRESVQNPTNRPKGRPIGSVDEKKNVGFYKLCELLDNNDDHQYTLTELEGLLKDCSGYGEVYTARQLKSKLQDRYKDEMNITCEQGKETIYTFLNESNNILRQHYSNTGLTPEESVDMAGVLIEDEIRTTIYDKSQYPKFLEMSNYEKMEERVSQLLLRLLSHLIKDRRRRIAISHSITSAARPRSFLSPILLGVSVYCNAKFESRELVHLLSSLAFADDYQEVLRLYSAMLPAGEKMYEWVDKFVNFVFDNADIDTHTLTGLGTWHVLGGIAGVTPAGEIVEENLPRSTQVQSVVDAGRFAQLPTKKYKKPQVPGLRNVLIKPLEPFSTNHSFLRLGIILDNIWLASFHVTQTARCPLWSGFNQTLMKQIHYDVSRIDILPFINNSPNHPDTLYSALCYAQDVSEKYRLGIIPVTFDQPLYQKAVEIVQASPDLTKVIVRLGGFHLLMSYMGAIGHIMAGSGLSDLWETVYGINTVKHMLTGHAYARALRAHMLTASSLVGKMLHTSTACNTQLGSS